MRTIATLRPGDIAFTVVRNGRELIVIGQLVDSVWHRRKLLRTLPCWAGGQPMGYFGTWFSQRSGLEHHDRRDAPLNRPRQRLLIELPAGLALRTAPEQLA